MKIDKILYILAVSALFSCGQKSPKEETKVQATFLSDETEAETTLIEEEDKVETVFLTAEEKIKNDSIEYEKYYSYTETILIENSESYNEKIISGFEKDRDTVVIAELLRTYTSKIFGFEDYPFKQSKLVQYTYLIDIDNNGYKDLVYQGPTGGEPNQVVIFLNQGDSFVEVFRQQQDIFEIGFEGNKLSSLSITNPGCCVDPQVVDYYYQVSFVDSNKPKFELIRTTGYVRGHEKPLSKFSREKKIKVVRAGAKLRAECYELDSEHPIYGESGNAITTYQKGSTGRALGEKNVNGVIWVYVLMDKRTKFDNDDYPTFKEQPTELYGWIKKSETDLK